MLSLLALLCTSQLQSARAETFLVMECCFEWGWKGDAAAEQLSARRKLQVARGARAMVALHTKAGRGNWVMVMPKGDQQDCDRREMGCPVNCTTCKNFIYSANAKCSWAVLCLAGDGDERSCTPSDFFKNWLHKDAALCRHGLAWCWPGRNSDNRWCHSQQFVGCEWLLNTTLLREQS